MYAMTVAKRPMPAILAIDAGLMNSWETLNSTRWSSALPPAADAGEKRGATGTTGTVLCDIHPGGGGSGITRGGVGTVFGGSGAVSMWRCARACTTAAAIP